MKKIVASFLIMGLVSLFSTNLFAQSIDKIINATEVERIERVLSSDSMQGRKIFTPAIDKAADFIAAELKKNGLQYFPGLNSYRQEFNLVKAKFISAEGKFDDQPLETKNILAFTTHADLTINNISGYQKIFLTSDSNFVRNALKYVESNKNYLLIVDPSNTVAFNRLKRFKRETFKKNNSVVFVLSAADPLKYDLTIKHELSESKLANVVGVLPGKSPLGDLGAEYIIFSAHYDHLGIGKPDAKGDSIYNGANDDAAGTTAVIMLSKYFGQIKNNERTIIFVAFTAEESGGYGSTYFSNQLDPDKVVAMFNIEMIGTESKWGINSAYITGYERSDFGKILQANLVDSKFHFEPDPYPTQQLFYRSDNARLAAFGVPAHTISTSKMDNEPNYHKQSDEIGTLDMNNMAEIIKSIAISSKTIVSGKDTPSRVEKEK